MGIALLLIPGAQWPSRPLQGKGGVLPLPGTFRLCHKLFTFTTKVRLRDFALLLKKLAKVKFLRTPHDEGEVCNETPPFQDLPCIIHFRLQFSRK